MGLVRTQGEAMTSEQLIRLYSEFFRAPKLDGTLAIKCSAPLLLDVRSSWETSNVRLLVVGQETGGWGIEHGGYYEWSGPSITCYKEFFESDRGIETLMHLYRLFNFATRQPENWRSPFWRAFRELSSPPEVEPLWSNLFRCSVKNGSVIRNCSRDELQEILESQRGLLQKEIKILKPNAVVFFTGPNYDFGIREEFEQVAFEPVARDRAGKFDRVVHEGLPDKCFRTYHPAYLQRTRRWQWLEELVHLVRSAS